MTEPDKNPKVLFTQVINFDRYITPNVLFYFQFCGT